MRWQVQVFLVWVFYLVIYCDPLVQILYWLFPLPLSPQDRPSLLYPVTLGTIQTQFSVASWLQVKLCQLGGLQGWRREQGLAPSSVLLVPVSITLSMTLHLAVTVPSKSNVFQFLFVCFFFPIVSEPASEILGSRPTLDLGPALQSPSSKLLSD